MKIILFFSIYNIILTTSESSRRERCFRMLVGPMICLEKDVETGFVN